MVAVVEWRNNILNSSTVSSFWPKNAHSSGKGGRGNGWRLLAARHGWHCAHVSAFFPFSRSWSVKETLVYTCVLITLRCLVMRRFFSLSFSGGESRAQGIMEGRVGGEKLEGFSLLLWMRYCLLVEHSWETSGHVDSYELAHTVMQKREHIHEVWTTPEKEKQSFYPLCLAVSFFSSLPSAVFFSNQNPLFPFSFLPVFAMCHLCGFTS